MSTVSRAVLGPLQRVVRRRRSGTVYRPPHAVQVELRGVRAHVPEALLQNCARILFRFDRAKVARERAVLCADTLELLRVRNKGRDLLHVPQRARPAEQRCRSCMRELRDIEVAERTAVARPAPAHAGPAQASLQDAEGQNLEILVVRARFLAGKAAAPLLLCERTFPGRAVAHAIFRPYSLPRRLCALFTTSRTFTCRAGRFGAGQQRGCRIRLREPRGHSSCTGVSGPLRASFMNG